jgi:serine/threonine-protein kinase HipA
MSELILDVRLDGFEDPVGSLVRDAYGTLAFFYRADHLANRMPMRLSMSLPLRQEPFEDAACRAFFGNLLQERDDTIQRVMDREGIARNDIASLLLHLGKDCPGAISVLAQGSLPAKVPGNFATDYERLTIEDVERIIVALHERQPLPEQIDDPSPIAGVQSKIALTILPDGEFALPVRNSGAPTTHILKVSSKRRPNETKLEEAVMALHRDLGFDTAPCANIELKNINCLLVKRYDRRLDGDGHVERLHQEDFAQALGLPFSMKYERNGREGARFDVQAIAQVIEESATPAEMRLQILNATLFDLMTGNVDAHAKNFSLLYSESGGAFFSPRYDLVPTAMFDEFTDKFAYGIGSASRLSELGQDDFDKFLENLGIESRAARRRLRELNVRSISTALADRLEVLSASGYKGLADLIASNVRHVCRVLGVEIPMAARERDVFAARSGGWLMPS